MKKLIVSAILFVSSIYATKLDEIIDQVSKNNIDFINKIEACHVTKEEFRLLINAADNNIKAMELRQDIMKSPKDIRNMILGANASVFSTFYTAYIAKNYISKYLKAENYSRWQQGVEMFALGATVASAIGSVLAGWVLFRSGYNQEGGKTDLRTANEIKKAIEDKFSQPKFAKYGRR